MAPAPLYAYARSNRWRLIGLLSSVALLPCTIVSAYAQTSTPAQTSGAQSAGETRSMNGTTTPNTAATGGTTAGIGAPTLRLSGLRFTAGAEISETYTNNALGVPTSAIAGYSGDDLVTTATISLGLHDHTPRVDADFAYSLAGNHFANHPDYDYLSNYLTALARADLIRNRLLLVGSAFAAPMLVNGLGPQAAGATNSGLRDTYGYTISPELMFRFGQFARSQTTLTQSSVFFVQPNGFTINQVVPGAPPIPNQVISYGASEAISSGPDFFRLNWVVGGTINKTTQAGLDFTSATASTTLRYAFSRSFIVNALFGYESLTSNQTLSRSLQGPTASGGVTYRPNNDFEADVYAGWAFNSPSYTGNIRYQIGGFTSFVGAVTDSVTTPGGRLIGNLGSLGVDGSGNFINTSLQLPPTAPASGVTAFNPGLVDGTAITAGIVRYRSGNFSLVHVENRTQYRLTIFHTDYDTLTQLTPGFSPSGKSTGGELAVSRTMTPRLTGSIGGSISKVDDLGAKYTSYQGSLNLNYQLSPVMQTYFAASVASRGSGTALTGFSPLSGNYSSVLITIGLRRQFY